MRAFFVFIKCEKGKTYDVAFKLANDVGEAVSVYSISGRFDLISKFELPGDADIGRFINENIHPIAGVADTETIICFSPFTKDRGLGEGA